MEDPKLKAPPGACDCHMHIYEDRFALRTKSAAVRVLRACALGWFVSMLLASPGWSARYSTVDERFIQAVSDGDVDKARDLIRAGADKNARRDGATALMWAVAHEQTASVRALIRAEVDLNAHSDIGGGTALIWAVGDGSQKNAEMIRMLIAAGAAPDAKTIDGRTALQQAALVGCVPCAAELAGRGADVNSRDQQGVTPLMEAARSGHAEVVRVLLQSGANIDAQSATGFTALMMAIQACELDTFDVLVQAGANIDIKGNNGETALQLARYPLIGPFRSGPAAAKSARVEMVKLLSSSSEPHDAPSDDKADR